MMRANLSNMPSETKTGDGKHLLITSDDFGMCHAVNVGIARAMAEGVVRSTNFMATCPWFAEAAYLANRHSLSAGVHLTVTCEWDRMKWGPITKAPSLVGPDGYFWPSYADVDRTAKVDEIEAEYEAQIARVRSFGIEPTHVDNHMLPALIYDDWALRFKEATRRVAERNGLIQVRAHDREKGHVHLTDTYEISGRSEAEFWRALESWTRPGLYEIISHAAVGSSELDAICSDALPARYWAAPYRTADLVLLTRPDTRARIEALGFELVDVPTWHAMNKSR